MKKLLVSVALVALGVLGVGFFVPSAHATPAAPIDCTAAASACSPQETACVGAGGTWDHPPSASDPSQPDTSKPAQCNNGAAAGPSVSDTIKAIINIMLFAVGVIAVIVIVVSSIRFVNSGGDTQQVSKAKDAIIYALVGVVIAASAFAIVNFVLGQL
jgi:hypothetical protein